MSALTGTLGLARLILRRDRWLMPLWIAWLTLVPVNFAAGFAELYPTAADRQRFADASGDNAALVALYGPVFDASVGALVAWRVSIAAVVVGLISLLTVIRHTRAEEEAGRRELLGSTVVGRHAGLAAALLTTGAANAVLAGLVALGLAAQDLPAAGSLALGLQFAMVGCVFAAVGGLTAQLTEGAGSARGLAIGILGAAALLRVGGDLGDRVDGGPGWLSWLSPLGWALQIRPYADERWWILALLGGLVVALAATAGLLSARRDVGSGLLPATRGPATASTRLGSPLALAWRLHRGPLIGWTLGFAVMGLVLGAVAKGVGELFTDNQDLHDLFARLGGQAGLVDAFLAAMAGLYGLVAAAYAVQATLRLRSEETGLRAEPVLAAAVSRLSWAGSHLVFAALGPAVALAVAGAATGLVHGLNTGDVGRELPRVFTGAIVQLPAVWLLAAIAAALLGVLPRLAAVSWAGVAMAVVFGLFGTALRLDQWLLDISPFTHLPKLPGGHVSAVPLGWLLAIAAALAATGLYGLRRRDVPAT
jgi:ABC-2 type transport system permease protein